MKVLIDVSIVSFSVILSLEVVVFHHHLVCKVEIVVIVVIGRGLGLCKLRLLLLIKLGHDLLSLEVSVEGNQLLTHFSDHSYFLG